jgi:hypothetical protein
MKKSRKTSFLLAVLYLLGILTFALLKSIPQLTQEYISLIAYEIGVIAMGWFIFILPLMLGADAPWYSNPNRLCLENRIEGITRGAARISTAFMLRNWRKYRQAINLFILFDLGFLLFGLNKSSSKELKDLSGYPLFIVILGGIFLILNTAFIRYKIKTKHLKQG